MVRLSSKLSHLGTLLLLELLQEYVLLVHVDRLLHGGHNLVELRHRHHLLLLLHDLINIGSSLRNAKGLHKLLNLRHKLLILHLLVVKHQWHLEHLPVSWLCTTLHVQEVLQVMDHVLLLGEHLLLAIGELLLVWLSRESRLVDHVV